MFRLRILVLDPSGNFKEGKGTTGYAFIVDRDIAEVGELKATQFKGQIQYWLAHISLINAFFPLDKVVMESYQLYAHKLNAQHFSYLETPQLIGVLTVECYRQKLPLTFQSASQVKRTYPNSKLVEMNVIQRKRGYFWKDKKASTHMLDAIRHAVYYVDRHR